MDRHPSIQSLRRVGSKWTAEGSLKTGRPCAGPAKSTTGISSKGSSLVRLLDLEPVEATHKHNPHARPESNNNNESESTKEGPTRGLRTKCNVESWTRV